MEDKFKERVPTLLFGPGDLSGWTSADVSGFRGRKPIVAIRELIQNSLDAAINEGISPARMRFHVTECAVKDIPGIDAYRRAFSGTEEAQREIFDGSLPDNAKAIADEIACCLRQDKCDVLYVLDNGIGLNEMRMNALLADGISVKGSKAIPAGSWGNGHFVVFPASDLRYVLYGGVSDDGMIGTGHAILASHKDKASGKILGRDGYFVKDLRIDKLFERYVFPKSGEMPDLIREQLSRIKQEWRTGSVVAVAGFNYFHEKRTDAMLRRQVFNAAARSFFEAIEREILVIEVEENGRIYLLDKSTLPDVLRKCRDQKRSTDSFLSGSRAYDAWLTVREGKPVQAATDLGPVEMKIRCPIDGGRTRMELCRNGMWITDRLPRLQNQFGELEAFHCVISLHENMEVKRLVRKAESQLHNELKMNVLGGKEKKQLVLVLEAIRKRLHDEIPKLNADAFRPDDVLAVPVGGLVRGGAKPGITGTPTVVKRYSGSSEDAGDAGGQARGKSKGKGGGGRRPGEFKRGGDHMQFRAFAVSTGHRSCRVNVLSDEKTRESEIRFALDESIDVTSDASSKESYVILKADTLRLNGRRAEEEQLVKDKEGNVLGVLLGGLDSGEAYTISMNYDIPEHISVPDEQPVVLKIEMIRRASQDKRTE